MRYFLFVLFWLQMLMPCGATGEAKRLSRLDARTRDSVMVARVQRLMMTKRPWLYRRDVRPVVKRWVMDSPKTAGKESEPYK